jgi:uncharacterized membrane protein
MHRRFCELMKDERGATAVLAAVLLTVLIGFAALGIDVGTAFTDRRKAQATADLAAIAAVSDLANADKAAAGTIQRNHHASGTTHRIEYGIYTADPKIAPSRRFAPSNVASANAARVTLDTTTPLFFARVLTGKDRLPIQTNATATRSAFATFAIGSRLLKLDGGLLNQLLGSLLDSKLSLSVMDYQALADTQVDLFNFADALATRMQATAGTYDQVLNGSARAGDVLNAMVDATRQSSGSSGTAVRALSQVAQQSQGSTTKMRVGSLVDLGPYNSMGVGQRPKVSASASALDLVTATAQMANGKRQVEAGLDVKLPGIVAASLRIAVGERPKGTSWVTVGAKGASVHTAQTRLLLTVQLLGSAPASVVNLPIYIELASATAKLSALQCGFPNVRNSTVTLDVTPGVVDAWIGDVSETQFTNFTSAPNPQAANLVNTPLLKVTGRSHVTVSNMATQPVTFSYTDIEQRTKKTVGTKDFAASLLSRLVGDTELNVSILGLGIGLPQGVQSQVAGILAGAVSPIDQLLSSVLQTLGVGLGQADVWVLGIRCDGAVLVI